MSLGSVSGRFRVAHLADLAKERVAMMTKNSGKHAASSPAGRPRGRFRVRARVLAAAAVAVVALTGFSFAGPGAFAHRTPPDVPSGVFAPTSSQPDSTGPGAFGPVLRPQSSSWS
ncbi:MAG TPA: hypothetical protein VHC41_11750 [Mycobacteriales bacterium]|nr:hypothetical protein [Mycobacteriales bacterium]